MNTGALSEAVITTVFIRAGLNVLKPIGDLRYDLAVEANGQFYKVQCKTGRIIHNNTVLEVNTCSTDSWGNRKDYKGEADLIAFYSPDLNDCFIIPVESAGKTSANFRLQPSKNNQTRNVRWAKDHRLEDWCERLVAQSDRA